MIPTRIPSLGSKVISADDAASLIKNGMTVGMGGFTRAGEAKAVPQALIERAKAAALKINLITGDIIATMCVGSLKG